MTLKGFSNCSDPEILIPMAKADKQPSESDETEGDQNHYTYFMAKPHHSDLVRFPQGPKQSDCPEIQGRSKQGRTKQISPISRGTNPLGQLLSTEMAKQGKYQEMLYIKSTQSCACTQGLCLKGIASSLLSVSGHGKPRDIKNAHGN